MRKLVLLGILAGLAALTAPAGAWANQGTGYTGTDCNYAKSPPQDITVGTNLIPPPNGPDPGGNQVYVYKGAGSTGNGGTTAVGACAYAPGGSAVGFEGGSAEAGVDLTRGVVGPQSTAVTPAEQVTGVPGAYVVADGNDNNTQPTSGPGAGASSGYIGASNYEDGTQDSSCNGDNVGSPGSTNSGGCVGLKPVPGANAPVPFIVCGNTSSPDWNSTSRDGCFIP